MSTPPYRRVQLRRRSRVNLREIELPPGLDARKLAGKSAGSFELGAERLTIVMPKMLAEKPTDLKAAAAFAQPWLLLREGPLGAHGYTLDVRPTRRAGSARLVLLRETGRVAAEGTAQLVDNGRAATFEFVAVDGTGRVQPRFRGRLDAGGLQLEATLATSRPAGTR